MNHNNNQINAQPEALQPMDPRLRAQLQRQIDMAVTSLGRDAVPPFHLLPPGHLQQPALPHAVLQQDRGMFALQSEVFRLVHKTNLLADAIKALADTRGGTDNPAEVESCREQNSRRDVREATVYTWISHFDAAEKTKRNEFLELKESSENQGTKIRSLGRISRKLVTVLVKQSSRQRRTISNLVKVVKKERADRTQLEEMIAEVADQREKVEQDIRQEINKEKDTQEAFFTEIRKYKINQKEQIGTLTASVETLRSELNALNGVPSRLSAQETEVIKLRNGMKERIRAEKNFFEQLTSFNSTMRDGHKSLDEKLVEINGLVEELTRGHSRMTSDMETLRNERDDRLQTTKNEIMNDLLQKIKDEIEDLEQRQNETIQATKDELDATKKELKDDLLRKTENDGKELRRIKDATERTEKRTQDLEREMEKQASEMGNLEKRVEKTEHADTEREQLAATLANELTVLFQNEGQKIRDALEKMSQDVEEARRQGEEEIRKKVEGQWRRIKTMKKEMMEELSYEFFSKLVPPHLRVVSAHLLAAAPAGPSGASPAAAAPPAADPLPASQPGPSDHPLSVPPAAASTSTAGPLAPVPRKRGRPSNADRDAKKTRSD